MLRPAFWRSCSRSHVLRHDRKFSNGMLSNLRMSKEVANALWHNGKVKGPVVALESTIYTHGFPYPENADLALSLEQIVRDNGGIPATIAIMHGKARVGLTQDELLELASLAGKEETMKVSRRDIPYILGMGAAGRLMSGGTTVSGTMLLANRVGIEVFGTGGLGGVHRGVENTMDISADLTELGRTPLCVVSSGCKSFLDIPRTLEYLETQGALVATFADGRTGDIDFPAFWTRDSGVKSPAVIQNEFEAAAMIDIQHKMGIKSGMLFANPIPIEHSISKSDMDLAINTAIQEANEKGFSGHRNTPFILAKIKELTEGRSVPANKALVESNVAVATRIAVELTKRRQNEVLQIQKLKEATNRDISVQVPPSFGGVTDNNLLPETPDIVVFGSVAVDLACNFQSSNSSELSPRPHTSNPATFETTVGGVGNNVANAMSQVLAPKGLIVELRSFISNDIYGNMILDDLNLRKQPTSGIKVLPGRQTALYTSINNAKREMELAMADMSILDVDQPVWEDICFWNPSDPAPKYVVVDANWPANLIADCLIYWKFMGSSVIFEPVSVAKSASLFSIALASPNTHELSAMYHAAKALEFTDLPEWFPVINSLNIPNPTFQERLHSIVSKELISAGIPQQSIQLLPFIPAILTKLGPDGVLMTELLVPSDERLRDPSYEPYILTRGDGDITGGVYMRHFPAMPIEESEIESVNGAGDTFLGVVVAGLASGVKLDEKLINLAQAGAILTLKSRLAVSEELSSLQMELENLLPEDRLAKLRVRFKQLGTWGRS